MRMPAAVESVRDNEGQRKKKKKQFAVSESALLVAAASYWSASSLESWRQWGPACSQWECPAKLCCPQRPPVKQSFPRSRKSAVGLEDNTACYGQEKLWVNMAICFVSPCQSVSHNTEASTSYERIKRRIYIYIYA